MDAAILASKYADELKKAQSTHELASISARIKADLANLVGFEDWLRLEWESAYKALKTQKTPIKDLFNASGVKWAKERGLL